MAEYQNVVEVLPVGTKVAILTDCHGMIVPLKAALDDMQSRGVDRIYSLGDNIGTGPNPKEVLELLDEYGVISVAGNAEDYVVFGTESFPYLKKNARHGGSKKANVEWTKKQLTEEQIKKLEKMPHSIDLIMGGKLVSLCHFFTDVRFSHNKYGVVAYQNDFSLDNGKRKYYDEAIHSITNSEEENQYKLDAIKKSDMKWYSDHSNDSVNPYTKGLKAALADPLFKGKKISVYDAIFQGHVHFKLYDPGKTNIYTLRALAMGDYEKVTNKVFYVILTVTENGYDIEEVTDVTFDRDEQMKKIEESESNNEVIQKYMGN